MTAPTLAPRRRATIPREVRLAVYERDGWLCWLCGQLVGRASRGGYDPQVASLDHVLPVSLGGSDDLANLRCAHRACNVLRGADRGPAPGSPVYAWALAHAEADYTPTPPRTCTARGCDETAETSSRCGRHYRALVERRWTASPDRPDCAASWCQRRAAYAMGGYCRTHARLVRTHGRPDRGCAAAGCEERHSASGYCARHARYRRRYGTATPPDCAEATCTRWRHVDDDLCRLHKRWLALHGQVIPACQRLPCTRPALEDSPHCARHAHRPCWVDGCGRSRWGARLYCPEHWHTLPRCVLEPCRYPVYPDGPLCATHLRAAQALAVASA